MTIQERAKDYSNIALFNKGWKGVAEEGYIKGATEQKEIDLHDDNIIYAILHLAHDYGVCPDWSYDVRQYIIEHLEEELKYMEE